MPEMRCVIGDRPLANWLGMLLAFFLAGPSVSAELSDKLPLCQGKEIQNWDRCVGMFSAKGDYVYRGEFRLGKKSGYGIYITTNKQYRGNKYVGYFQDGQKHGKGSYQYANGDSFVGEFKNDRRNGFGLFTFKNGDRYEGEFKDDKRNGRGTFTRITGEQFIGVWADDVLLKESEQIVSAVAKRNPEKKPRSHESKSTSTTTSESPINSAPPSATVPRKAENLPEIQLTANASSPDSNGLVVIDISTGIDTSSLKVNGREEGGSSDGRYSIKRIARIGQVTDFNISATDIYGRSKDLTISVSRRIEFDSAALELSPEKIPTRIGGDAVAIIIGINKYRSIPWSDHSSNDARLFFEYARKALGVRLDKIKLLVDENASETEIIKTLKLWLPQQISRDNTTIYLFFSGHGYVSQSSGEFLFLPHDTDMDLIDRTSLNQTEVFKLINDTGPKKTIAFIDSCFSGFSKSGSKLVPNSRPLSLTASNEIFYDNVNVITATQKNEISFSSDSLQHGIFSYFLMKGLEGNADLDGNKAITLGELYSYLEREVPKFASKMNKVQNPKLIGNPALTLIEPK
jgi:hypothetical protein